MTNRHEAAGQAPTAPVHPPAAQGPPAGGLRHAPVHNRLAMLMLHVPWYTVRGQARLAADAGVSRAAVSRLVAGQAAPSYALVWALSRALGRRLGRHLDPAELVSLDGTYPTPWGCALAGCRGCYPEEAHDDEGNLRAPYRDQRPGDWSRTPEPEEGEGRRDAAPARRGADGRRRKAESRGRRDRRKEGQ